MRELRIDFLGHDAVAVYQILRLLVEKTRIGAQKFREVVKAAFKPCGCDDFVHLRANSLHFGEAGFVNLLRRQVRCRLPANMERVGRCAIRQRRGCDGFAARRQISGREIVVQLLECGLDGVCVNPFRALGQPGAIRLGESRGKFGEGLQQRACHGIGWNEIGNLFRHIAQHQPRRRIAFLQAFLKEYEILFDVFRHCFKPGKYVFVFRDRLVRHGRQSGSDSLLDATHLCNGHPNVGRNDAAEW